VLTGHVDILNRYAKGPRNHLNLLRIYQRNQQPLL